MLGFLQPFDRLALTQTDLGTSSLTVALMPALEKKHLRDFEIDTIVSLVRRQDKTPQQACDNVNRKRKLQRVADISLSAVQRCLAGSTHQRNPRKRGAALKV